MLLPALARAKSKASQTACINNMRQLGIGMSMYLHDNEDQMAWPNWGNDYGPGWLYIPKGNAAPDPWKTNDLPLIEQGRY